VAEKRLPGCERRKRYGRRVDVIERFRLGREIVRMDGNEFRSAAITVKRSKAVASSPTLALSVSGASSSTTPENSWPGIEGVRGSPFAVW